MCLFCAVLVEAKYSHKSQGYFVSSCLHALCSFGLDLFEAENEQRSGYFTPMCTAYLCLFMCDAVNAECLHRSQGYLIPSCLTLIT